MNIPPQLLVLGGILLFINVSLPLLLRSVHENASALNWDIYANAINRYGWLLLIPVIFGCVNFLRRTENRDDFILRRSWFPLAAFTIWMLATSAHLYCIGYVYSLKWSLSFLAPLLWMAAWTLRNRINDFEIFTEETDFELRDLLLIPPALMTLVAARSGDWPVFFALTALNTGAYIFIAVRNRNVLVLHLALISAALMLGGTPETFLRQFDLHFSRGKILSLSVSAYFLLCALLSRSPKIGLLGSLVSAAVTVFLFRSTPQIFHVALQIGFVFVLLHSLRWQDKKHEGAANGRIFAATLWVIHSAIWLINDGTTAAIATTCLACATLSIYSIAKWIFGFQPSHVVAYAALIVLLGKPILILCTFIKTTPTGFVAVTSSFILFALGTLAALTKNYWHKNERAVPVRAQMK